MTGMAHFSLNTADLFMAHFHLKSVLIKNLQCVFQCRPNISVRAFPVLFFQKLRREQLLAVPFVIRCFDPEFQFRRAGDRQLFNVIDTVRALNVIENIRVFGEQLHDFFFEIVDRLSEYRTGSAVECVIMNQKRRDPQCSDRQAAGIVTDIIIIVINVPVGIQIRNNVDLRVAEVCDSRQHNAGAVRLDAVFQHILHIFYEKRNRDLLIRIMSAYIDSYK